MSIEALVSVMPPPAVPFEAFDGSWEQIEADLRTALPQDYKDFARLYGGGYFMEFLGIHVPKSRNTNVLLVRQVYVVSYGFRDWDYGSSSYRMWPEPGGLIAFGGTDNGDTLFWHPVGDPNDWRVVIFNRGMLEFEPVDCSLTDFLAGLVTGDLSPQAFPELLPCDRLFEPHDSFLARRRTHSDGGR